MIRPDRSSPGCSSTPMISQTGSSKRPSRLFRCFDLLFRNGHTGGKDRWPGMVGSSLSGYGVVSRISRHRKLDSPAYPRLSSGSFALSTSSQPVCLCSSSALEVVSYAQVHSAFFNGAAILHFVTGRVRGWVAATRVRLGARVATQS